MSANRRIVTARDTANFQGDRFNMLCLQCGFLSMKCIISTWFTVAVCTKMPTSGSSTRKQRLALPCHISSLVLSCSCPTVRGCFPPACLARRPGEEEGRPSKVDEKNRTLLLLPDHIRVKSLYILLGLRLGLLICITYLKVNICALDLPSPDWCPQVLG